MSVHLDVNNVPTSDESDTPTSTSQEVEKDTTADDDTTIQYPAPLALFFLMTAISISVSLTSLDRTIITTVSDTPSLLSTADRSSGDTPHYRSIPLLQWCRLVCQCVPHHRLFLFTNIRTHIRHGQLKVDLSERTLCLWSRKSDMRCDAQLQSSHSRSSHCRSRKRWGCDGSIRGGSTQCSIAKAAIVRWYCRNDVRFHDVGLM